MSGTRNCIPQVRCMVCLCTKESLGRNKESWINRIKICPVYKTTRGIQWTQTIHMERHLWTGPPTKYRFLVVWAEYYCMGNSHYRRLPWWSMTIANYFPLTLRIPSPTVANYLPLPLLIPSPTVANYIPLPLLVPSPTVASKDEITISISLVNNTGLLTTDCI